MSKFWSYLSKALDKRTDAHGRVQYLVCWRGYGKKYDSWLDDTDTNERLKQVFRTLHQGTPGLLQTLTVLVAEKLNMKKPPTTSIVRRASVTMPMDTETFKELFGGLPSAPNLLRRSLLMTRAKRLLSSHNSEMIVVKCTRLYNHLLHYHDNKKTMVSTEREFQNARLRSKHVIGR